MRIANSRAGEMARERRLALPLAQCRRARCPRCRAVSRKSDDSGCLLSRVDAPGGTWRCLVRRDIHAPHLRADAMPRTPELALASACARHLTPTPPLLRR